MGFTNDLFTGLAVLLDGAGVAKWDPAGVYADGDTGIFIQVTPPSPDPAVMLFAYPVSDDPTVADSVVGLQVMTREAGPDTRPVNDLSDAVFDQLQGLHDADLSTGAHVVECTRRSGVMLGQDDLRRQIRTDNYYLTVYRPGLHRL